MRRRHSKDLWKRKVMLIVTPCWEVQRRSKHPAEEPEPVRFDCNVLCVCVCGRVKHLFYIRAEQAESWRRGVLEVIYLFGAKKSFNHRSCDCKWICSLSSARIEVPAGRHTAVRRLRTWGPSSATDILCHCCYVCKNCVRVILLTISFFLYKGNYRPGRGK